MGTALLILIGCLVAWPGRAAQKPLSQDDVQLLLLGGATEQRMLALVNARGVDFRMTPALEKKFREAGATDPIIEALEKAGPKPGEGVASAPVTSSSSLPPSGHDTSVPAPPAASSPPGSAGASRVAPASSEQAQAPAPASVNQKIAAVLEDLSSRPHERRSEYPYAPMFSLKDLSGAKLDLHNYKGKVVMLDFWATWCGPCRSEIPKFVELERRYHERGFQLIGISVDRSSGPVRAFYQRYGMNYPVALCDSFTRNAYGGLRGVPTTLLIGRDGRIYATVVGAPADLSYFEEEIRTLLAEPANGQQPMLAEATKTPGNAMAPLVQVASAGGVGGSSVPSSGRASASRPAAKPATPNPAPNLSDPSAAGIQTIIQAFAAKEELFKEARDGYTFHQINKVETLDADDQPTGEFEQDWDILYDDNGKRIERVTYAPLDTLKDIQLTEQDLDAFRNLQPFVLTTSDLPEYDVDYLGHVKLDKLTAYVFRVRPKVIEKGKQYFQGVVWVDDRDLQIVKAEGKNVPETKSKNPENENLFPRFTTWREQIDGKFWFPTFTMADDTLYFSGGAVKVREIVKYTDYKQFKSTVKEKILVVMPDGKTQALPKKPPKDQKP